MNFLSVLMEDERWPKISSLSSEKKPSPSILNSRASLTILKIISFTVFRGNFILRDFFANSYHKLIIIFLIKKKIKSSVCRIRRKKRIIKFEALITFTEELSSGWWLCVNLLSAFNLKTPIRSSNLNLSLNLQACRLERLTFLLDTLRLRRDP